MLDCRRSVQLQVVGNEDSQDGGHVADRREIECVLVVFLRVPDVRERIAN